MDNSREAAKIEEAVDLNPTPSENEKEDIGFIEVKSKNKERLERKEEQRKRDLQRHFEKEKAAWLESRRERSKSLKNAQAKTVPAKTIPTKREPAKTEPAKKEHAKSEPAKTEPAKKEHAKTERTKTEPAKKEPAKTEPSKAEPTKKESAMEGHPKKDRMTILLEQAKIFSELEFPALVPKWNLPATSNDHGRDEKDKSKAEPDMIESDMTSESANNKTVCANKGDVGKKEDVVDLFGPKTTTEAEVQTSPSLGKSAKLAAWNKYLLESRLEQMSHLEDISDTEFVSEKGAEKGMVKEDVPEGDAGTVPTEIQVLTENAENETSPKEQLLLDLEEPTEQESEEEWRARKRWVNGRWRYDQRAYDKNGRRIMKGRRPEFIEPPDYSSITPLLESIPFPDKIMIYGQTYYSQACYNLNQNMFIQSDMDPVAMEMPKFRDTLIKDIREHIELFFTKEYLDNECFIRLRMNTDGFVAVKVIGLLLDVPSISEDFDLLCEAIMTSSELELRGGCVRTIHNPEVWPMKPLELQSSQIPIFNPNVAEFIPSAIPVEDEISNHGSSPVLVSPPAHSYSSISSNDFDS